MNRRYSLRVGAVDRVSPTGCSVDGEVWLGPLLAGHVFTVVAHGVGGSVSEEGVNLGVEELRQGTVPTARAEPGSAVSCALSGNGSELLKPGDVLLGEAAG